MLKENEISKRRKGELFQKEEIPLKGVLLSTPDN
jgi:hypothetical protein